MSDIIVVVRRDGQDIFADNTPDMNAAATITFTYVVDIAAALGVRLVELVGESKEAV
jgi:hypothetical protein